MQKVTKKVRIFFSFLFAQSKKVVPLHCFNKQLIVLQFKIEEKMKKLVLVFVAVAAMSFASCGNKAGNNAPAADSDSIAAVADSAVADSAATDSAAADTAAADAAAPAEEAPVAQ
ncbi:MAG: hypothetical protein SO008_05250 [Bacteroidaceae bacterium]|nr:hypothetical protein [Bacteroidaceae bacterium]